MNTEWTLGRDGTPGAALRACAEAAVAAPSVHNSQPWRFRPHDGGIDVYADHSRRLDVLDPTGRELMISVGAAVTNLRLAMLTHGRMPALRPLPDPSQPDLAVQVTLGRQVAAPQAARRLASAVPRRHTSRRPFWAAAVPAEVHDDLVAAAWAEGADLIVAHPVVRQAVLGLVRTAETRQRQDPAYRAELAAWTRDLPGRRDGVPPDAFGPWDALEIVPIRDFGLVQPVDERWAEPFEDQPAIAVLYTFGDTPREWLRAGQALERVLLTATVHDLATTLMTQPVEIPELRALLTDRVGGRIAQAIVRFGYGPPTSPSPRRPLEEVLVDGS